MTHLLLPVLLALASQGSAACTRSMLQDATALYIRAQAGGKPDLLPLGSNLSYAENDVSMPITKGVISTAVPVDFNRSLYDTTQCISFTEITSATGTHPYVIDTRLLFTDDKITKIESVVADAGDWIFDATSHLSHVKTEKWDPIPSTNRDTRSVLKAAGDAYLDSWGDGKVSVPYGTPCARLEGGSYTGDRQPNANTCKMPEFPQPFNIAMDTRKYTIDEELGGLDIFNNFPFIDKTRPNGTSSMNLFRVEAGKIRYIHETTICATKGCGR
ncbi:hypothetical protein K491DRAFT_670333 [Lophiostoma macrostomum CBS 122681]|uniref:DUF8021 domain-containing protein n=1 Tax=Lophiostoma macrostomum CBS 122681 TaxID=1314788 RepID=A0A6A6SQI3_9PLEO|nr:hypothetical protein K491DRAFT_670333 [Lophiostoma macrostomum CBS 122681]